MSLLKDIMYQAIALLICFVGSSYVLYAQKPFIDKQVEVLFKIDENEYQGKVRVVMECEGCIFQGGINQNRPSLYFPGNSGRIRVRFSELSLPDNMSSRLSIPRNTITHGEGMKIPGTWTTREVRPASGNASFDVDVRQEGSGEIKIEFGIITGNKEISVPNVLTQSFRIQFEDQMYAQIMQNQGQWNNEQHLKLCQQFQVIFTQVANTNQHTDVVLRLLLDYDKKTWDNTDKKDPRSIVKYLNLFESPNDRDDALAHLKTLHTHAWNQARNAHSIRSYHEYIVKFENIRGLPVDSVNRAKDRIEGIENEYWNRAQQQKTVGAYQTYLNLFDDDTWGYAKHKREAEDQVKNLKPAPISSVKNPEKDQDRQFWEQTQTLHTLEAYRIYAAQCTVCDFKQEALRLIELLQPIEKDILRDSLDIFRYEVQIRNSIQAEVIEVTPETGVEWAWIDSSHTRLEIIVQDRKLHQFVIRDSLGKTDTFEIDIRIEPLHATVRQEGNELVFEITDGLPPYFLQFQTNGRKSELYRMGGTTEAKSGKEWRIPIGNLSADIETGLYHLLIKDHRGTESFTIRDFELTRLGSRRALWMYLALPLMLITGFLVRRNMNT